MTDLSPGMQQYMRIKEENPDCLVLFRMGDFYETFYEDAKTASKVLGITLTSRGKGEKRAPLAGIPFHALEPYLKKLVLSGHKVALVEQLEDPKKAKGLVKRGLVRIVTPGTITEDSMLQGASNNFLLTISVGNKGYGLAACDISTGEFLATEASDLLALHAETDRFQPGEIVLQLSQEEEQFAQELKRKGYLITLRDDRFFWQEKAASTIREQYGVATLEGFGLGDLAAGASGALISYLQDTQKGAIPYLKTIRQYSLDDYMKIDPPTLRNLELLKNIRDNTQRGTLFSVLDKTCTSMGARRLKSWLLRPLVSKDAITQRHDAVEELGGNGLLREDLRDTLKEVSDIERILSRVTSGSANARDLNALAGALSKIPGLKGAMRGLRSGELEKVRRMEELEEIAGLIGKAIQDEPPVTLREGNLIRPGYDTQLDDLRGITAKGRSWISEFEEKERERTGIKSLKVRYNRVFGYFIEVTKANLHLAPQDYIRKQTQVNGERFVTEELKEKESLVLGAQEKIHALEYELFLKVTDKVVEQAGKIQEIADRLATLDALLSLSQAACEYRYVRPDMTETGEIIIKDGRHPVVERIEAGQFVPNDTSLKEDSLIHVITGPNMAGKSTYLRQVALITLLSQMGSFVPARSATLGIVDRIFTRVGAVDDLSMGQSTFMVEMVEVASILNNATSKSLIIMDEVGRGTSTYDGLSLAWAITEYIDDTIRAKTLFATHYHQLNKLASRRPDIKNFNIRVKEVEGDIIFMRKIVQGGTDKSYGIHVAKLAGLPQEVLERARVIQGGLEDQESLARSVALDREDLAAEDVLVEHEVKKEIHITETIRKKIGKAESQKSLFEVLHADD